DGGADRATLQRRTLQQPTTDGEGDVFAAGRAESAFPAWEQHGGLAVSAGKDSFRGGPAEQPAEARRTQPVLGEVWITGRGNRRESALVAGATHGGTAMIDVVFVVGLAAMLFGALVWGARTLPAERWQMIAAVPMAKNGNGEWQGLNLTFYGFFSATASTFGVAMAIVLLSSVGMPLLAAASVIATMMAISVPASKLVARLIEGKRNTFTIAGAAFLATLIMPPGLLLAQRALAAWFDI